MSAVTVESNLHVKQSSLSRWVNLSHLNLSTATMKLALLSSLLTICIAFAPSVPKPITSTALSYTVFGGISDDDEKDEKAGTVQFNSFSSAKYGEAAASQVQQQQQKPPANNNHDLSAYKDEVYEESNGDVSVDSYSNTVSGGIMPGFQLTGLCGDD